MKSSAAQIPTSESVLSTLTQERLLDLSRVFGIGLRSGRETKSAMASRMGVRLLGRLPTLLRELGRDELRLVCRRHGVDAEARKRLDLQIRLVEAAGLDPSQTVPPPPMDHVGRLPQAGQVLQARHRQWMVEQVDAGEEDDSARLSLVCLDDDAPGQRLEVLWDLEVGARVIDPSSEGIDPAGKLDAPSHFGAYLHALKWSAVSAADATRFQAPFRAGIKLMAHQLTPLMKALELPRANLFIADDVGLGKTIEAGLVLQELILRQQADFVLVACPASICLQWRDELQRRFGLRFEVMTQKFVGYRRKERGFGINPWATHNRFIISHNLLRRAEYRELLLAHLGPRARKSLLILDEAHVAAPASRNKYAVDSETTHAIRELAPRFDNRLFLSATPHNGHSNSFSALLELLDPVRFTRGVPISGPSNLAPVMVRRLKRDLRKLGVERFAKRMLVQLALSHEDGRWTALPTRYDSEEETTEPQAAVDLGAGEPLELTLADKLERYTKLCAPKTAYARRPFIRLQQRLLSSPEAFARTLEGHARVVMKNGGPVAMVEDAAASAEIAAHADPDTYGEHDDVVEAEAEAEMVRQSASLADPSEEARQLLSELRALAEGAKRKPDAKVRALLAWMREHQCPAAGLDQDAALSPTQSPAQSTTESPTQSTAQGPTQSPTQSPIENTAWSDRRVILFTEWGDTKRYLHALLGQAIAHTDRGDERILLFHGGMGDDAREEVQRAFNSPPDAHPVRILIATDAAREGLNLQSHCADLFHFDLPWNPSRLEQRNGRIDRTLQPSAEVRCHYFHYPQRREDRVLETLVRKVETVHQELGSLGAVLLKDIERTLEPGIVDATHQKLQSIGTEASAARSVVDAELEAQRKELAKLEEERAKAARRLDASQKLLQVEPASLRGVVEVGLQLAGAGPLEQGPELRSGKPTFVLPELDRSWDRTLDSLRPARKRSESFWEWRSQPPRRVVFEPLDGLTEEAEQLHLAHPLVRRILSRFVAQGYSAHDLSRVAAVVAPDDSVARVIAYARLTLFGPGAARLHDEVIAVAAAFPEPKASAAPYRDAATAQRAIALAERLLVTGSKTPSRVIHKRVAERAQQLYADLWPALDDEADARAVAAKNGLAQRARREADDLRALLERQRKAIDKQIAHLSQSALYQAATSKAEQAEQRQLQLDVDHMRTRLKAIAAEVQSEPRAIEALYDVRMTRLSPVGLVVTWPEVLT